MIGRRYTQKRRQHKRRMCQQCFSAPAGYTRKNGEQVSDRDHDMCRDCFSKAVRITLRGQR
jgi:hypothetical protein